MFDTIIFCDWSANSTPKTGKDSLWLCRGREVVNPSTRREAEVILTRWIETGGRTLVGYDFPLGLPALSYAALGFRGWRDYWTYLARALEDGPRNENNRFEVALALNERAGGDGPFWGAPKAKALRSTKPPPNPRFPDFRKAEIVLRERGARPFSVWQLLGNGSVGSQSMVGIPMIARLRKRIPGSRVWPFESTQGARVVHAEAGPIAIDVDYRLHPVRDAAQMLSLSRWAKRADLESLLRVGDRREGWVLGIV